jgi:hypothetical protein
MVLNELGQKISQALAMVNNAETIDEKVRSENDCEGSLLDRREVWGPRP